MIVDGDIPNMIYEWYMNGINNPQIVYQWYSQWDIHGIYA